MRPTTLGLLTTLALLAFLVGCRESDAVLPGNDTGDDTDVGNCSHSCVSQLFCVQADGVAHGELDCVEDGEICCDLSAGPDADTDSDTDTGEEPCPFECMSQYMCNAIDGEEHDGYACEELTDICCEEVVDTDTGYKGTYWNCLICEPDQLHDSAAEQGAGVLGFIWNIISGG